MFEGVDGVLGPDWGVVEAAVLPYGGVGASCGYLVVVVDVALDVLRGADGDGFGAFGDPARWRLGEGDDGDDQHCGPDSGSYGKSAGPR